MCAVGEAKEKSKKQAQILNYRAPEMEYGV